MSTVVYGETPNTLVNKLKYAADRLDRAAMSSRFERKQRLSALLKGLIADKKWSERELARQLGVSPTSVQGYMDCVTFPGEENRVKIAQLLNLTREELDAELDNRPVRREQAVESVLREIRAMNTEEFSQVARVVFDRAINELSNAY